MRLRISFVTLQENHTTADFAVKADPVYALKVTEQSAAVGEAGATVRTKNHLATAGAAAGTYRLEFDYHDRTEYWDFIVQ